MPDGRRGADSASIHDDMLIADALTARLDGLDWKQGTEFAAAEGEDVLERIKPYYV